MYFIIIPRNNKINNVNGLFVYLVVLIGFHIDIWILIISTRNTRNNKFIAGG
jgi:hypothetical protein